ncbi:hypothetical protein J6590_007000 [Homalodisca vitripennis]|nr:hypothetical protein J6590_007000 [Homalodisca vitripennis]
MSRITSKKTGESSSNVNVDDTPAENGKARSWGCWEKEGGDLKTQARGGTALDRDRSPPPRRSQILTVIPSDPPYPSPPQPRFIVPTRLQRLEHHGVFDMLW